jgi:TatA/E family protein of Tat protein translocase
MRRPNKEYVGTMTANIFGPDLGIVVLIILLVVVFGSQLPKIARNVGTAGREFRKAQQEAEEEAERDRAKAANAAAVPPPPAAVGPAAPPPPLATPPREESVTLTRSELDALLRAREDQAKRDSTSQS